MSKIEKGKDLLLKVGGKCVGHCTSHTITYNTETNDTAVKPPAKDPKSSGRFKGKYITGQNISISFEGLQAVDEEENGIDVLTEKWGAGEPVEVEGFKRSKDTDPYLKGNFVIDSLTDEAPADGDATYSGQLSNDGEPEIYPGKAKAV